MRNNHLVIFAKAPRMWKVKRRLARDFGDVEATRFYRNSLGATIRRLSRDSRWRTWLSVTPDRAVWQGAWPGGVPRLAQGSGDLGDRMQKVMDLMAPGPVVIVGADVPGMRSRHIADVFRLLGNNDAVFGPATDGGYWLVGLRRSPRVPQIFNSVRWSTSHALEDTLRNVTGRVGFVETLQDVDTGADLLRVNQSYT